MIFGVDEDGVVRTRGHARLATDADRLIKIDDAVGALEHRRRRTRGYARSVRALVATRHLVGASRLRKHAHVNVFDVCARDGNRNDVFRLAGGGARVTADAACMVDYLGPLNRGWRLHHKQSPGFGSQTITCPIWERRRFACWSQQFLLHFNAGETPALPVFDKSSSAPQIMRYSMEVHNASFYIFGWCF